MLSKFEYNGDLNPKFNAGSFTLQIEYIKAYDGKAKPQCIFVSEKTLNHLDILAEGDVT